MLIYHPAYDAYHCIFRALLLTESCRSIEIQKLRILDFFLCFPAEIGKIRLPREHADAKRMALQLKNDYHGPVSVKQVFRDMEHIQLAAFRSLAASEILDQKSFEIGLVERTDKTPKDELKRKIDSAAERDKVVIEYLVKRLVAIPLYGSNGLKDRTDLMEYRYDTA